MNLFGRSFLKELDFTKDEFVSLLDLASSLRDEKRARYELQRLLGRNIALIFEKTSTRTRSAFEVAAHDQGAHVSYLGPGETQLGKKESIRDMARSRSDVRRNSVSRLCPSRRRGSGAVCRRSRLERPHRSLASNANAGRHADHAGSFAETA